MGLFATYIGLTILLGSIWAVTQTGTSGASDVTIARIVIEGRNATWNQFKRMAAYLLEGKLIQ